MLNNLEFILLNIALLYIGTGLYSLYPGTAYILILIMVLLLFFDNRFIFNRKKYISNKMIYGFIIYVLFFSIEFLFNSINSTEFIAFIIAIFCFIIVYIYSNLTLNIINISNKRHYCLNFIIFLALFLIFSGQIAQIFGYIENINFDYSNSTLDKLFTISRPGGFLNPNESSSIALILLFISYYLNNNKEKYLFFISFIVTLLIVMLSQSRASLIVLSIAFLMTIKFTYNRIFYFLIPITTCILILYSNDNFKDLVDNAISRFDGDSGSEVRLSVISFSLDAFFRAPFFGNGSTYIVDIFGISTHNQLLEIAINFGLFGVLLMTLIIWLIYYPASLGVFLFCYAPFFFFSHNFFNSAAIQTILALALTLDRIRKKYGV